MSNYSLEVNRNHLDQTRITDLPEPQLEKGQAIVRVDQFAITANNITYGVTGDMIGYCSFSRPKVAGDEFLSGARAR